MPDKRPVLLLFGALAACGGEAAEPCPFEPPAGAPVLAVLDANGHTVRTGDIVTAVQGPQGGFHIVLALWSDGLYPGDLGTPPGACMSNSAPCVDFTVEDLTAGGTIDAFAPVNVPLDCGSRRTLPRQVVLAIPELAAVDGHMLRIRAAATDSFGTRAEADLTVTCEAMMF